jgi:FkbM family methyltransferase
MSRFFKEVYSFEPQTPIYHMLCANIALNNRTNIKAANKALYDRDCLMTLAPTKLQEIGVPHDRGEIDYTSLENAAALAFEVTEDGANAVEAHRIDKLQLTNVGFIKVDTQGSDLSVLRGAEKTIQSSRPVIVFEYERELSAQHGHQWNEFEAFFEGIGYELSSLSSVGEGKQIDYIAVPTR